MDVEANEVLEKGTLVVAAKPETLIRDLMEAVRKLVSLICLAHLVSLGRVESFSTWQHLA